MQTERWEEWEGTGIRFTLAAFGLRMSWSHFFFNIFFGRALEKFSSGETVRNGAKHP